MEQQAKPTQEGSTTLRDRVLLQCRVKPLPLSYISVENDQEQNELPQLLECLIEEGVLRSHEFKHPTADMSMVLYFIPPQLDPGTTTTEINQTQKSSPEETPASPAPETPPKANHLNRPMSAALKSRLGKRRPSTFISPLRNKQEAEETEAADREKDTEEKEKPTTPIKRRKLLHSPSPRAARASTPMSEEQERKMLLAQIKEKEKQLEEAKRKKFLAEQKFSNKQEQEKVEKLIEKWRSVCQEVLVELHNNAIQRTPDTTIPQLLEYMHVEPETVGYSVKDERFL